MELDQTTLLALASALAYSVADMSIRYGIQHTNAYVGTSISHGTQLVFNLIMIPILGHSFPDWGDHYLWIMAGGIVRPALFAILFSIGIARIGVARAAPLKGASPLLGALLAIIFLGENPAWYHLAGIVLVVAGGGIISSGKTAGYWNRKDIVYPITASLAAGVGAILWRKGLVGFESPIAGAAVGIAASFFAVGTYTLLAIPRERWGNVRKAALPFLCTGLVGGAGNMLFAAALQQGEVYRVLPLVQISPIITVILAVIFLRRIEWITWRIPAGAALTAGGAILVTLRLAL
ncbi:MAG: EamA family transporter [bacterium]|nr:EamA family transporter [bacterium]